MGAGQPDRTGDCVAMGGLNGYNGGWSELRCSTSKCSFQKLTIHGTMDQFEIDEDLLQKFCLEFSFNAKFTAGETCLLKCLYILYPAAYFFKGDIMFGPYFKKFE